MKDDCIFCKIINKEIPSNVIYEDDDFIAILDINPICDGHTLIIPKNHYETVFTLPPNMLNKMYEIAQKLTLKIMDKLNEKGTTLLFNYGDKQEIKHVHMHILPDINKKPTKDVKDIYKLLSE